MQPETEKSFNLKNIAKSKKLLFALFFVFILALGYFFFISSPSFAGKKIVNIPNGTSLKEASMILKNENIVRSDTAFYVTALSFGGENTLKAGSYLFEKKENVLRVAWRVLHGTYGIPLKKITITEGMNSKEIFALFADERFSALDREKLSGLLKANEGYVFPDTYFVPVNTTAEDFLSLASSNFDRKTSSLELELASSTLDLKKIITMASIIEGEANTDIDRKIVAGILWKRISIGMPLQVDATFKYINGKGSSELSLKDLAIDSPYNTYIHQGLPPTPIDNPGLEAILSVIHPTQSEYLYYLTGSDGAMHYAKTFEEHKKNKEKYIK